MRTSDHHELNIVVRLQRGVVPRRIRIAVETRLAEPDRIALGLAVGAFFEAVEAGFFGPCRVSDREHRIEVRREGGVMADLFEASFSKCRAEMFAVLVGMTKASVPGVVSIDVREPEKDERTLVHHSLDREADATIPDLDFRIEMAASSRLVVRFVEAPTQATTGMTARIVRLWSELVHLGGYPPPDLGCSRAVLQHVGPGEAEELVFDFAALSCGYDAYEALFLALDAIHERQAIERVSIPYRPDGHRRSDRTTPPKSARSRNLESRGGLSCG